jgi:hypothetical protein
MSLFLLYRLTRARRETLKLIDLLQVLELQKEVRQ